MTTLNGQTLNGQPFPPPHAGQAVIPFASFQSEDKVTVIGQTAILATSKIQRSLVSSNDDVYAQDWEPPISQNIVPGVGFDLIIRPAYGTFKGPVSINWSWT